MAEAGAPGATPSRRPILLLVNPEAGGKPGSGPGLHRDPARLEPPALLGALEGRGLRVTLHVLEPDDDPGELARQAASEGSDVVVMGGDGTVGRTAAALLDQPDAALGILAGGSFNNVARGFGIPVELDPALDVIERGAVRALDVGWIYHDDRGEGRAFFEAAGVGFDAIGFLVIELAGRRGWWRALRALWRALRRPTSAVELELDGQVRRVRTPAVTISNGPYHGMGFAIAADADPTDGHLDVGVFARMGQWEVLRHFLAVARRRRRRDPRLQMLRVRRVTIRGRRRALPVHADGESVGTTPVTVEARPAALRVFC